MHDERARAARSPLSTNLLGGLAAGLLACLGGCGQVSPAGDSVPLDQAPRQIAETVCPKAYDCCTATELMGNKMAGTDEPSCEAMTEAAFHDQLAAVQASQQQGRSRYDGAKLLACLSYIRSSTCQMLGTTNHFSGIPGCDNFVQPLVDDGGECTAEWECVGGACQNGHCAELPAAGGMCLESKCAAGAACNAPNDTCVATTSDGASCTLGTECPSGVCTGGTCSPRPKACFYASGCSLAGGSAAPSLAALAAAALLIGARAKRDRRSRGRRG